MGATIHPHKGYLNTNFNVHVTGHEEEYSVYQKGDCDKCLIATGIVRPNEPHVLNIAQPGDYVVSFNDSDEINIHIEKMVTSLVEVRTRLRLFSMIVRGVLL